MNPPRGPERAEAIRDRYRTVFGAVPPGIDQRVALVQAAGRLDAVETIEELRQVLAENPLGPKTQQLVHFAQLVASGREGPARLHAQGALRAGASIADLVGVAETSLVTAGMPAYAVAVAVAIIAELNPAQSRDRPESGQQPDPRPHQSCAEPTVHGG